MLLAFVAQQPLTSFADYEVFVHARPTLQHARNQNVRYFAGDYWRVWPAIFTLRAAGQPVWGAFSRGIALQAEIQSALHADHAQHINPVALCVDKPLPTCREQLQKVTLLDWELAAQPSEEVFVYLQPIWPEALPARLR